MKDYVLILGDLSDKAAVVTAAPCVATCRVFEQKSAEAILGAENHHAGDMVIGNELGE